MDDLVVDNQLAATVVDDEGTDGTTALGEGTADPAEEAALGHDGEALLDIAGLGHGDDGGVVVEVQDAVGLVDGAEHGLDDDRGGRVRDEAGLLLQLAVEQVDTQVPVLAGLGGHRDPDHLARAALEDQDVADADEVAGDGDGVRGGTAAGLDDADILTDAIADAGGPTLVGDHDVVVVAVVVEGVQDAVGSTLDSATEGVVVAFVVVVAHLANRVVVEDGVGSENFDVGAGNGLNVNLGTAVGVSAERVDARSRVDAVEGGSRLVRAVERVDARSGLGAVERGRLVRRTAVRDVGLLDRGAGVGLYGLVTTIVRDVDLVVGVDATTVLSFSIVEFRTNTLIVAIGFGITGGKSEYINKQM